MNKKDLEKLGLTADALEKAGLKADVLDEIIVLHGKDIEKHKTDLETAQKEAEGLKTQLTEANKQIESFKSMDIEGVKKSAEEWKTKAEAAEAETKKQVSQLKFNNALDKALADAKVKDVVSVKAHLKMDALKLNDDESILGLKEQLDTLKTEKDFLFESDTKLPKIVLGADNRLGNGDGGTFADAIREKLKVQS
ncbi:MAG: hypothetical protein C4545_04075 [Anaerolineaceae bacterium]|jgi:multidrug resistance efflux pump|nr:MAG: hypothetical protein C4545_04075 [Anaerolineaceae bacterium]